MATIDGTWDCVSQTPMGDQKSVMTLRCEAGVVTGTTATELETVEITEGQFDGRVFTWKMRMTAPMKMNLRGEVVVDGDAMSGGVAAFLGSSDMTGRRRPG